MTETLLSVQDLHTYLYTTMGVVRAVDGVNLEIGKGEYVGLVGESGCGKTMTALSIMRLIPTPPARIIEGKVLFKGVDLVKMTSEEIRQVRGKQMSMVFQDPMTFLNPVIKVGNQIGEVLLYPVKGNRPPKEEVRTKVLETLRVVKIPTPERFIERYPHELSGGMRQRALLAMALLSNPSLLIADEPTTALDVSIQAQIIQLLKEIRQRYKLSLMLVSHDLGLVAELCDKVYVMYAGKVVESADVFELYENPSHPYTKGLLRSVLSIDEYKEKLEIVPGTVPSLINPPSGCRFFSRCSQAMTACRDKEPPPITLEGGHVVSCWLYA